MASTHKHIRSGTANKRPTTAIADGQIALATNIASPGLFFKDSAGATIVKIGPVHVGATAPNASPAGSAGNSTGEVWLDNSLTPIGVKIYDGSAFVNATPIGSTTVQGLLELATDAETQAGADTARAVTSASLQSKLSDSTSTTSNTTIASSTAVKAAYDLANAALPKTGGTVTGNLEIGTAGSLSFEGATADGFETTIAITDPTADRTITLPNTTGTVVTTGDSGTVTSTMLLDGTIVDADIDANAEISVSKLVDGSARQLLQTDAAGTGVEWASNIDIPGTLDVTSAATFDSTVAVTGALTKSGSNVVTVGDTGTVTSTMLLDGTIVDADINASAAIAGTKISPDFGAQTIVTTGVHSAALGAAATPSLTFTGDLNTGIYSPGADQVAVATNGTQRLTVDTAATTSTLPVVHPLGAVGTPSITFTGDLNTGIYSPTADTLAFVEGGSEAMRIDSSGRLLVGTATSRSAGNERIILSETTSNSAGITLVRNTNDTGGPAIGFAKSRGTSVGSNTIVQNDDLLGALFFLGADGADIDTTAASIRGEVDGTPGSNDMPGRLVFSTTADGGSSPTERMRITSDGDVLVGKTTVGINTNKGTALFEEGSAGHTVNGNVCLYLNRLTSDGTLAEFRQANTTEGTISVSGTTVSYNGAHLSRWSQLPSGAERTEILRGSVLSNIDEMCEWGDEDNEQLNRMKVSDVEGDKNVSGVFQDWDDDDDTYTNDFYCAMTGDFIIRIAEGVTVERGDLLMSAGDGTARPQDDDIICSKTIAKVTSTNVSCTYDDGSYCVPCVLMAC